MTLPPSPLLFGVITLLARIELSSHENRTLRCIVGGDVIRFFLCQVFGPVNRPDDRIGKVGRDVVKILIISDNQDFHSLIIKPFDNQTVTLP